MDLKTWRVENKLTLADLAARLGLTGPNPGRNLQRIEMGENRPDADLIAAIERFTDGAVDAAAMNETRLAWLKSNDKARTFPDRIEAAE
jgi:transcriptional regulator with XRE-family HTH domain